MKYGVLIALLAVSGCATVKEGAYRPNSSKEKSAFSRADMEKSPADVQENFHALENSEMAWAGVIKAIQFKETERTIQVAFQVDHRSFDWMDHGGGTPYQLSATGDGMFVAGWTVKKPASISYLKTLAKPGYMILVYGKPYRMKEGVVQLSATAVRLIEAEDYTVLESATGEEPLEFIQ